MSTVLLVVQVFLALALIGIVLIQRSESDGFGMGSGGGFGVMSGRAKANLLTRTTAILAALFMLNSLLLTVLMSRETASSIVDQLPDTVQEAPVQEAPVQKEEKEKEEKATPASEPVVPRAQ
jgi:preprotein translocase subunit SecG